jgi:hypothetical protein
MDRTACLCEREGRIHVHLDQMEHEDHIQVPVNHSLHSSMDDFLSSMHQEHRVQMVQEHIQVLEHHVV